MRFADLDAVTLRAGLAELGAELEPGAFVEGFVTAMRLDLLPGVQPERALHVGNSQSDETGPLAAGMRA